MTNKRVTHKEKFANTILHYFYSPRRNGDSAMNCADMFRDAEWMALDGEAGENTRADLCEIGKNDQQLLDFIIEVIDCMRWNVSQIED